MLTAGAIAAAVGGQLLSGNAAQVFDGFSIDSRTTRRGDLFIAIRGERLDGAAYRGRRASRPARAASCSRGSRAARYRDAAAMRSVIVVDDATAALQMLGRHVRRASGVRVTAITGSAGKTTTKEVDGGVTRRRGTLGLSEPGQS